MVFMEESELSSKRWASAPRRSNSPCILGTPTSREAAGPPVQLEPVDLSLKTPVVLQVPRYSPAALIAAAAAAAARKVPSPSTATPNTITTSRTTLGRPAQALQPSICLSTASRGYVKGKTTTMNDLEGWNVLRLSRETRLLLKRGH
ncbi:PREDICTED: uncharacterized protein LOC105360781 [Ceratosolen solmsi marchali]|uniref:Uncharacterized protein LOC105360781 n=1 Tax=Ceratosolen solmsi marchali TaxID=326594 RepID=A0AAJ6YDJ0_9HYME|nr:PREDICTED: uncharacterized protein LOC105360781 [Ceratosolen solmsi marchali]